MGDLSFGFPFSGCCSTPGTVSDSFCCSQRKYILDAWISLQLDFWRLHWNLVFAISLLATLCGVLGLANGFLTSTSFWVRSSVHIAGTPAAACEGSDVLYFQFSNLPWTLMFGFLFSLRSNGTRFLSGFFLPRTLNSSIYLAMLIKHLLNNTANIGVLLVCQAPGWALYMQHGTWSPPRCPLPRIWWPYHHSLGSWGRKGKLRADIILQSLTA